MAGEAGAEKIGIRQEGECRGDWKGPGPGPTWVCGLELRPDSAAPLPSVTLWRSRSGRWAGALATVDELVMPGGVGAALLDETRAGRAVVGSGDYGDR